MGAQMKTRPNYFAMASSLLSLLGCFLAFTQQSPTTTFSSGAFFVPLLSLATFFLSVSGRFWPSLLTVPLGLIGAFLTVFRLGIQDSLGQDSLGQDSLGQDSLGGSGYWLLFWGFLLTAIFSAGRVSLVDSEPEESRLLKRLRGLTPPATVPFVLLLVWQALVLGYQVPRGIFPSVTDVYLQLSSSLPVLLNDSYTTFVKEVFFGFTIGLLAGFLAGVGIALSSFLQRGFLPFAAAFGAVPIVGLAPVLGRAFGVDWESKAAVVVITTFFPVVLNTVQGLTSVDITKLELLKAYAAKPSQVFFKLRLPNALPYLFNALKLAAVLSVISVIVAEFLIPGPPVGLGQRISLSARRGAYDVVFAAIFVSSVFSIIIYGLLSWLERRMTGWHPSFREIEN
jgi:NitT/TauT family transport system permease protein